ncbi:MAG: NAD(P)-binding domain-containing protein [Myxococcota bacterium]
MAELAAAGKAARTPREVGERAELVGICVPEDKHVHAVVFGDDGLLAGMASGGLIAIHSTVLPSTIEEIADAAAKHGIEVMDACVTGGAGAPRSAPSPSSSAAPMRSSRASGPTSKRSAMSRSSTQVPSAAGRS